MTILKQKRYLRFPLMIFGTFIIVAAFIFASFQVMAASSVTLKDKNNINVVVNYDNATNSGSTFTVNPKVTCASLGEYSSATGSVTINNGKYDNGWVLKCNYALSANGTVKFGSSTITAQTGTIELDGNTQSLKISLTSGESNGKSTSITLTDFEYSDPNAKWDVTINGVAHGTVTIGGTAVADGQTVTKSNVVSSAGIAVTATPESGYRFLGLIDSSKNIHMSANGTYNPTASVTLTPVFAKTDEDPVFSVGSKLFTSFSSAVTESASSGKPMIPVQDCILPSGNYNVTSGATLLIPFDAAGTCYTSVPVVDYGNYTTPTPYRTMTMSSGANITVKSGGAISVGSKLSCKGQMNGTNGCPTGYVGRIKMMSNSNITVESNAKLYAWGYIFGDGMVEMKSNSTVYEAFQIKDYRGGGASETISSYAFIFSQYYVQNIEVPLKLNAGATEALYSSISANSTPYPVGVDFIGGNGVGMFQISDGYLIKDYIEATDKTDYQLYGSATIAPLVVSTGMGDFETTNYRLPINGGMSISVNSGTTSIAQDLELLPDSEVNVAAGATISIPSGKNVYLFDNENWSLFTGQARMYAVGYSVANGTTAIRTADNMKDAKMNVNGTVNINGNLYTSEDGADITSSVGTVGTDGKIVFNTAPPTTNATIYEMYNNSDKTAVTMYPPLLHNGDDTYSATISTGKGTWYYDKSGEHWYRYLVDFMFRNKLIARDYYCENNDTIEYNADWLATLDNAELTSGTADVNTADKTVTVTNVTADTEITLTGTPYQYKPTFVLNEKQYSIYQLYTGNTISDTTTINGDTYYIVAQAASAMDVGEDYAAPSDAAMGVSAENHNDIIWNLSGISYTSGDPYRGTVPAGAEQQGPAYIYGFYDGNVAYNNYTDKYYKTLFDAFGDSDMPGDATATITLLADCGTFEEESGTLAYVVNAAGNITLDLNGYKATGRIINNGICTLELNGGTFDYVTGGATAAGVAAVLNDGTMTIQDSVGGGKVTADGVGTSSFANYNDVIRNNTGASLTVSDVTLQHKQNVNNYSLALLNYGSAVIDNVTMTPVRGMGIGNSGASSDLKLRNTNLSFTGSAYYGLYNTSSGKISEIINCNLSTPNVNVIYNTSSSTIALIDNCDLSTKNVNVIYNTDSAKITSLKNTDITVTTPTTKNVYAVFNYGGTIATIDSCNISANSGINNRNKRGSNTIAQGYNIAHYGTIGTIKDTTVDVGQYALYNGGKINTLSGSTFIAHPASAQVPWGSGTATLNGNSASPYTIVNSNLWWYDSAVWKRTDTSIKNGSTTMLQRRISEYKTDDDYMPTIGAITDCTIKAQNTSTSNSYGYYALQNLGVIDTIDGSTTITSEKHPDNAKSVVGQYALRNESGGKIGSIGAGVSISAYSYAIVNLGARYSKTDTTYSTTYIDPKTGALSSGGLATDYVYTYADVSEIGSTAATVDATSQYAFVNYSKIGSVTGTLSANYNVIVNAAAAATTTTSIDGTTANSRAIEHRYFDGGDASTTDNEIKREFEYTRNTEDGCYIGTIDATVTATGAGYQAVSNQGYIGTLAGTVSTPTGKAAADSSTVYPLIYNGNQRQATLKQTEEYYVESNDYGATKYDREYTYVEGGPTINELTCTATNPLDYTIRNLGTINTLSGNISGSTNTVVNGNVATASSIVCGAYLTRKTRMFYSSATRFAATKASSEVDLEYTKQPATIHSIDGATIDATTTSYALHNYGYVDTIKNSELTSKTEYTIGNSDSTVTRYTSNRADVLTGCVPSASTCALAYDMTQTINEDEERVVGTINKIAEGNYIAATTYYAIYNLGRINTIDSGSGKTTIILGTTRQAVYNLKGAYSRRTNTDAVLTKATGSLTNHYTYEYTPAYIGTIKNVYIQGKRQAIFNGDNTADYNPVTIGEIGEGAELRTTSTSTNYPAVLNQTNYAKIEKITGGIFTTGSGTVYGLANMSTTNPIEITGGYFRGGNATRALAINDADNTAKYTYASGKQLSSITESATYHTLASKKLTAKTNSYYYIENIPYTVTWKIGDTTPETDTPVYYGDTPTYNGSTPTKAATAQYTYTFDGWTSSVDGVTYAPADLPTVSGDVTYTAHFAESVNTYTVTWDIDGTTTTEEYGYGDMPSYTGVPTKPTDDLYSYTFSGWSPALTTVTGDVTYTAQFTPKDREYTITWLDDDGSTIDTTTVKYNVVPTHADPSKEATAEFTYTFTGWTPNVVAVTGDATYTATYSSTKNTYTVTWDIDGTTETQTYEFGATPTHTDPTKAEDDDYTYSFTGWSPAIATVTGNATYTAQFSSTLIPKYNVTWQDYDGTVLETDSNLKSGVTPTYDGATPSRANTAQYSYAFLGWSTDGSTVIDPIPAVADSDVTYKAVYSETVNTYTVTWGVSSGAMPTDEEVKAGVDALIAEVAQRIYNDAKTEGDFAWEYGMLTHEALVKMHLEAGGVSSSTGSSAYITKRIIEIVDNGSADFSAADALWDTCKDTIASDFAKFSGYTSTETGEVYSGLTAEQKASMEALAGPTVTALRTDTVAYGTTPSYSGSTPTKEGDDQYSYTFAGWSTDGSTVLEEIPAVTGNATYIAVFTQSVNTYTINWIIDNAATDEELRAALDELIATFAQRVFDEAREDSTDVAFMWTMTQDSQKSIISAYAGNTYNLSYINYYVSCKIQVLAGSKFASTAATVADSEWANLDKSKIVTAVNRLTDIVTDEQKTAFAATAGGATVLETDEDVPYGTPASYDGATPTKEGDAQYSYTFAGWSTDGETVLNEIPDVTGNATYKAVFTQSVNTYTVNWAVAGGGEPTEADIKAAVDEIIAAYADKIYADAYAEMAEDPGMWSIMRQICVESAVAAYYGIEGDSRIYIAGKVIYLHDHEESFNTTAENKWDSVKDDIVDELVGSHNLLTDADKDSLSDIHGGATVLETDSSIPYGTVPTFDGVTPTKESDETTAYNFVGWSTDGVNVLSEIPAVTGDVTYIAVFNKTVYAHSLTLTGDVGLNFYMDIGSVDPANAKVKVSWATDAVDERDRNEVTFDTLSGLPVDGKYVENLEEEVNSTVNVARAKNIGGSNYQISAYIPAKQMNDLITVEIYNGDNRVAVDTYKVSQYADSVIDGTYDDLLIAGYKGQGMDDEAAAEKLDELKELSKAMLTYGAKAQEQFDYNIDELADKNINGYTDYLSLTADKFAAYDKSDEELGISEKNYEYYGSSILLEAETTYAVWFCDKHSAAFPDATATIDGEEIEVAKLIYPQGEWYYNYVRYNVLNIPANKITKDITLTVDGVEKTYNTQTYFYKALQTGEETLENTVKALYNYNQAAVAYFG